MKKIITVMLLVAQIAFNGCSTKTTELQKSPCANLHIDNYIVKKEKHG